MLSAKQISDQYGIQLKVASATCSAQDAAEILKITNYLIAVLTNNADYRPQSFTTKQGIQKLKDSGAKWVDIFQYAVPEDIANNLAGAMQACADFKNQVKPRKRANALTRRYHHIMAAIAGMTNMLSPEFFMPGFAEHHPQHFMRVSANMPLSHLPPPYMPSFIPFTQMMVPQHYHEFYAPMHATQAFYYPESQQHYFQQPHYPMGIMYFTAPYPQPTQQVYDYQESTHTPPVVTKKTSEIVLGGYKPSKNQTAEPTPGEVEPQQTLELQQTFKSQTTDPQFEIQPIVWVSKDWSFLDADEKCPGLGLLKENQSKENDLVQKPLLTAWSAPEKPATSAFDRYFGPGFKASF